MSEGSWEPATGEDGGMNESTGREQLAGSGLRVFDVELPVRHSLRRGPSSDRLRSFGQQIQVGL